MAEKQVRGEALRALSVEELNAQLQTLRRELWQDRVKAAGSGSMQRSHRLKQDRRHIARILTVLRGREVVEVGAHPQQASPAGGHHG